MRRFPLFSVGGLTPEGLFAKNLPKIRASQDKRNWDVPRLQLPTPSPTGNTEVGLLGRHESAPPNQETARKRSGTHRSDGVFRRFLVRGNPLRGGSGRFESRPNAASDQVLGLRGKRS